VKEQQPEQATAPDSVEAPVVDAEPVEEDNSNS